MLKLSWPRLTGKGICREFEMHDLCRKSELQSKHVGLARKFG